MFSFPIVPARHIPEYLTLAMGQQFTAEDLQEMGERIAWMRMAFNLREGVCNRRDYKMPERALGEPPLEKGPVASVTVDNEIQIRDYYVSMGVKDGSGQCLIVAHRLRPAVSSCLRRPESSRPGAS